MTLRNFLLVWVLATTVLAVEFLALHMNPGWSLIALLQHKVGIWRDLALNPEPGRAISLALGWSGISIMLIMNLYTLKKRFGPFKNFGPPLSKWFDFHIFCGLLGPTLIIFHCDFKVRGLVAISFWSMIISAASGVIGRYLYVQLLGKKKDYDLRAEKLAAKLTARANGHSVSDLERIKSEALVFVGAPPAADETGYGPIRASMVSIMGDLRLLRAQPGSNSGLDAECRQLLTSYALAIRQGALLKPFQKLMGYWHTFHLPFAFFMYAAAIIHIAAALLFGVSR